MDDKMKSSLDALHVKLDSLSLRMDDSTRIQGEHENRLSDIERERVELLTKITQVRYEGQERMESLGRMEGTVEQILENVKKTNGSVAEINERVVVVEAFKNNWLGKFSIITIAIGAGVTLIIEWFTKHFNPPQ